MVESDSGTKLRSFNRFELKYVVERGLARTFRNELAERMLADPHQKGDSYRVRSLYWDTSDLAFYWEKIDGLRFRRKVRIRHYGDPIDFAELGADTQVFLEIKQRVNKVTQKRRHEMTHAQALGICRDHQLPEGSMAEHPLIREVLTMCETLELQPTVLVNYWRDGLIGDETEPGLRVTFDTDLEVRGNDLDLTADVPNRIALEPDLVVVEIKVNDKVPHWLTETVARHQLQLVRVSKYCQGVEVLERAPRSAFHVHTLEQS